MTLKDSILKVATEFARVRGLSMSRVSTLVFGDGRLINRLQSGSDLTTSRYEQAMLWFSTNWPEGAVWPEDVVRPEYTPASETSEAAA